MRARASLGLLLSGLSRLSLPHSAAFFLLYQPPFGRQAAVERDRREGGRVERTGRRPDHPSALRPVGQLHSLGNRRIGCAEAFKTPRGKLNPEQTAVLTRRR
jgi:hypothetical protein